MPSLLQIVLSNAIMATALALLVAVIGFVVRRPALTHVLWLLVLLKLITPGVVMLPVSWPAPNEKLSSASDSVAPSQLVAPSESETDVAPASDPRQEVTLLIYPAADSTDPDASLDSTAKAISVLPTGSWQSLAERVSSLWPWCAPLWLAGSLLWLAGTTAQVYRFHRLLRHAHLAPAELQEQVRNWCEKLGLRKPPALWLVPGCISPMLWTMGRSPRLLFPAKLLDRLDAEQRSALLVHELAHLRRRDHWARFLEMAVTAVYWWHPVVWWARRELHEAEEQCCDAWVVWALTSGGRGSRRASRSYALALLHTVDFFSHARPTLPAPASGVGQVPHLRRRLTMIMNGNTSKSLSAAGRLAVLAVGLLLPLVPIQAQQPPSNEDRRDPRDEQIENLKKVINALEDQKRAEQAVRAAQESNQPRLAEELDRIKKEKAKADEQQRAAFRALRLQEAQLAQNLDPEQRIQGLRIHLADDKADPNVHKAMEAIDELARMIKAKQAELRALEEKLRQAQANLEQARAEGAREAERGVRVRDPLHLNREPIIIKVDPSVDPEQIKAQVESQLGRLKQPIRVEIVKPDGKIQGRIESARPVERRDSRTESLEQKLERIMKEVEELRRELRSSRK
jgi:beta-lactamase regulating signal transducer with metallopeptidase domain